jgi:hypothetical protein
MYHGNDEYESRAARSAINEFAQYAVPGVRIQEAHEIFAYAAGGGLSDDKIVSYYTENRADIDQAAPWVAEIVAERAVQKRAQDRADDRAASTQGIQDRADMRAVAPEPSRKGVWTKIKHDYYYRDPETGETLAPSIEDTRKSYGNNSLLRYEVEIDGSGERFEKLRDAKAAAIANAYPWHAAPEPKPSAEDEWFALLEEVRLTGDTREADAWKGMSTKDKLEQVTVPSLGGSVMENLQMQIDNAYSESSIAIYLKLHPKVVTRNSLDDDEFYTVWELRTGYGLTPIWEVDRTRGGAGLHGDDDFWTFLYRETATSRPIALFEQGFNPNEEEPETMSKAEEVAEMAALLRKTMRGARAT